MRTRPALRAAAAGALCLGLCLGPVPLAAADGPGYGGDAGQLSVSWGPVESIAAPDSVVVPIPVTPSAEPVAPASEGSDPSSDQPVAIGFGSGRGVSAGIVLPPRADPQLQPDATALIVRGLGFRSRSRIEVRIGSDQPVVARADASGALSVALDPQKMGGAQPGVSVMAVGRNQSGTEVTLFGSVPPTADGTGPMSLVPWVAGALALVGLAVWIRRRRTVVGEMPETVVD